MNYILFVLLRRLRAPLITVVVVYAISILGFVLIPGVDDQGQVWHMSFFHAFYFVSFMGSTIGFGEIPYAFTDAQRMWTIVTLYATVITWLYSIGRMLSVFQEKAFIRQMKRSNFERQVKRITEPFYLVCGYGMTGSRVVSKLSQRGIHTVVLDCKEDCINGLETDDLVFDLPGLCADASQPDVLKSAGLERPNCIGVLALTDQDSANLAIAIASKLLAPERPVICRSASDVTSANLASFGTDHIIDPFVTYAENLAMAVHSPYKHLVFDWLTNPEHQALTQADQHIAGRWIICGYGRFGRALQRSLEPTHVSLSVIDPVEQQLPADIPFVQGAGIEAVTLQEAQIDSAVGLIAGTDNDANNLSIIMTALELNPQLFTVARQNLSFNAPVFEAARCDLVMDPSRIVANDILTLIKSPLLKRFLREVKEHHDEAWAQALVNRMSQLAAGEELDSWSLQIDGVDALAVVQRLRQGVGLSLNLLLQDPADLQQPLAAMALMLKRQGRYQLLPDLQSPLQQGDEVLFCGLTKAQSAMRWIAENDNVLAVVNHEPDAVGGSLARWWRRQRAAGA